jgi:hypothetical protein
MGWKVRKLTVADVFRYLCAEMACMGIRLNVNVT